MKHKPKKAPPDANPAGPVYLDREPPQKETLPTGPWRLEASGHPSSLLFYVPRNRISSLINDMTGGYGYSHLAVDCGETDIPTGKRVMIEVTVGLGVHYSFQDEYGDRKFVRISLDKDGIDPAEFCDCIRSKVGEKYDDEEALSFGMLNDPTKQICSDLVTVCLPPPILKEIASQHRAGLIHTFSAVRVYGSVTQNFRLFVSPNGFAEYFKAPKGSQL